jgi:hypothetical protein
MGFLGFLDLRWGVTKSEDYLYSSTGVIPSTVSPHRAAGMFHAPQNDNASFEIEVNFEEAD